MTKVKQRKKNTQSAKSTTQAPFFQKKDLDGVGKPEAASPFFASGKAKNKIQKKEPELDLINPFVLTPEELNATREKVLKPLRNYSSSFSNALRSLNVIEADAMLGDAPFWKEVKKIFRGRSLWAVFSILYRSAHFGKKHKEPDLRLSVTLSRSRASEFLDALALVIPKGRTDQYYNILLEAVNHEFKGLKVLHRVRTLIKNRKNPGVVQKLRFSAHQVHYEKNKDGDYELKHYGPSRRTIRVYETGNELRAIVRIRFVDGKDPKMPFYMFKKKSIPEKWKRTIKSHWNNKFILDNGVKKLKFTVAPMFYYEKSSPADKQVRILPDMKKDKCSEHLVPGRANAGCWFEESETGTIAHEFGHLLGASDEYNLPGSLAEVPGKIKKKMSKTDLKFASVEGVTGKKKSKHEDGYDIPGLMGARRKSTEVFPRYLLRFVEALNKKLPKGTPPYKVKRKK